MQNSYNNGQVTYAGFWVRAAAYVIDSVLVFFGLLIVRLIMSGVMSLTEGTVLSGDILFQYTLKDIALYIAQVLYFILCTYYTGTTLGKRAMNLRVVAEGEKELTFFNVVYRETIGRFLSAIILHIGYIIAGIDPQKRALHDIHCETRVIYGRRVQVYPVYQRPAPPAAPMGPGGYQRQGMPAPGPGPSVQEQKPPCGPGQAPPHESKQLPPLSQQRPPYQKEPVQTGYHMVEPEQDPQAGLGEDKQ